MERLVVVCVFLGLLCVLSTVYCQNQTCQNSCAMVAHPCTHDGECCKGGNVHCPGAKAICHHSDHSNPQQCGGVCQCTNGCRDNVDCNDDPNLPAGCLDPHCYDGKCQCGLPN